MNDDGTKLGSALNALRAGLSLLWEVADRYTRTRLVIVAAFVGGSAILSALTPVALKLALDRFPAAHESSAYASPLALIVLYICGQYLTRCLSELRFLAHGQALGRIYRNVGLRFFRHLLRLPMRFHFERKTGAMAQIGEQGINGCEQLLHYTVFTILPVVLEFSAVALVLVHFGYPAYLLMLGAAAVAYIVVFERGAIGVHQPAYAMAAARIDAHASMTDNLINAEVIKYYDAEPAVSSRYEQSLAKVETAWRDLARRQAVNGLWVATVFAASLALSLVYATFAVYRGDMTIGDFVLVNSYVMRFVQPLEMLGIAVREMTRAVASLQRLIEIFQEPIERDAPGARARISDNGGELVFEGVSFDYGQGTVVLSKVDLRVACGRSLAVVGVSGSGKSSLIRLLFRLYEPTSGRIVLDGVPIARLSLSTLRRAIAIVPQDTVLFHDTIANNIAFGRHDASCEEIVEAARLANLHEFINRQPEGYDTVVGERGLKLSGGERQRVAIARAALKRPRIFVFDEATSSLDSRTEREILKNLRDVSRHSTTLVIAHRLSTIVHADEIVVLHEGSVLERGSHTELLRRDGHYAMLWRAQQGAVSGEETADNAHTK